MRDKLTIHSVVSTKPVVIEFGNEAFLEVPQTLRDWKLVFAGYMAGSDDVADEIDLFFNGEHYTLDEDGEFVKAEA